MSKERFTRAEDVVALVKAISLSSLSPLKSTRRLLKPNSLWDEEEEAPTKAFVINVKLLYVIKKYDYKFTTMSPISFENEINKNNNTKFKNNV